MGSVLHAGIAPGHRGNPAAGIPVLLSGLSALVLTKGDEDRIDKNHKETISNIQRLFPRTPRSLIYFLGGSLQCSAFLHLYFKPSFMSPTRPHPLWYTAGCSPSKVLYRH